MREAKQKGNCRNGIVWNSFKWVVVAGLVWGFVDVTTASGSVLSQTASALQPGQSIRMNTIGLREAVNLEGSNIIQWGNTGDWDPTRKKAVWVGKRHSLYPYHRLEYDEATNTWRSDVSLHPDLTKNTFGHGYDGTAVDPTTGDLFFRLYRNNSVYWWDASSDVWGRLPEAPGCLQAAEAIEWWPGRGLVFSDVCGVSLWDGHKWATVAENASVSGIGYHSMGEVQPNADVYVFGGGNDGPTRLYRLDRSNNLVLLGPAPIALGNASSTQGILVHDPASKEYIAWDRGSAWFVFDPLVDEWQALQTATGDGTVPANGAPPFAESNSIAIPISDYGVIMFVGVSSDGVWLYKHDKSTMIPTLLSPPTSIRIMQQ